MAFLNLLSLLTLTAVILVTSGLMCQFPHCELVKCNPVPENCTGTVQMGGGYCGCCMACFTYIDEGDYCEVKDALDAILYPSTNNCASGLYCDKNSSTCKVAPHFG